MKQQYTWKRIGKGWTILLPRKYDHKRWKVSCRNKEDNIDGKRCLLQKKGINEWKTKYKFEEGNNHVYDMECGFIQIDNLNLAKGKYQKMREKTHIEE